MYLCIVIEIDMSDVVLKEGQRDGTVTVTSKTIETDKSFKL